MTKFIDAKMIDGVGYLRLSSDDGTNNESTSITNQRKIILEFAKANNINITEFYIDDGYSGYSLDRPAFNRLKQDLNSNKVNLIIAKDISRIGRHSAKTQTFLENILESGKRVITINDNYDTLDEISQDMVGIQTWVNEKHIRDTSTKVRKSIKTLQKEGKWICTVPYGYIKDMFDKTKYTIDPLIAPYVKQIFDMYINGMGLKSIAKELTDMNIPTPSMIKKQQTEARGVPSKRKVSGKWDVTVISRILKNDFYIGTLTLSKSKVRAINGKQIPLPEEERHVFKNAHEPIIDLNTFNLTQEITKNRSFGNYRGKKIQTRDNLFAGLLYCSDCGKKLTSAGGTKSTRYICRTYNVYGTSMCTSHAIMELDLIESLMEFLEHCRDNLSDVLEDIDKIIQAELQHETNSNDNIQQLIERLDETKKSLEILIEQKIRETIKNPGMIDVIDKMYNDMQNEKYKEIKSLEKQIEDQENIAIDEVEIKKSLNSALSIINNILTTKKLTKKQVLTLVDKITVYEDNGIDIYLKGNLHELCNNYFKISDNKLHKIKRYICEFILENPNKFITNDVTVSVRNKGIPLTYKTVSKIIKEDLLENKLIEIRPANHGYKLVATPEELKSTLLFNNVASNSRWQCKNNVIIDIAHSVSQWINGLAYKKELF